MVAHMISEQIYNFTFALFSSLVLNEILPFCTFFRFVFRVRISFGSLNARVRKISLGLLNEEIAEERLIKLIMMVFSALWRADVR